MKQLELDREIGNRTSRTGKLVFAAVLMSALLSACGGDSDPAPVASAAPSPSGSASAPTGGAPTGGAPTGGASGPGSSSSSEDLTATPSASAGSTTLSWTPPTRNEDGTPLTLTGYKIYWGQTEGNYPHSVEVANPGLSRYVVEQLAPATWYFVATALSADGESEPSNVVRMQVN